MKFITLFALLFFSALHTAPTRPPVKTSVVIPCYITHVPYLENLLAAYADQTVLPDEVVISISSCEAETEAQVNTLRNKKWPYSLIILTTAATQSAGKNRNNACDHASGDLFICQDADDIPHRQRIEVIASLHKKYHFDHLLHSYFLAKWRGMNATTLQTMEKTHYKLEKLKIFSVTPENLGKINKELYQDRYPLTNGNPAYTRAVFQKVRWREDGAIGEDIDFNRRVYATFRNNLIVKAKLYCYQNWASSFD
jgi:glycosyltransferase involved in cell wall biosynthesis